MLYSLPSVVFAMSIFTFPFMVMNIGTALSNVDPTLEEAAACLGARPWQTFRRILLPLTRAGIVAGHADGLRLEHRDVRRAAPARARSTSSAALAWTLYQRGVVQSDYGLSTAMGVVLLVLAFVVIVPVAALLARSAGPVTRRRPRPPSPPAADHVAPARRPRQPRLHLAVPARLRRCRSWRCSAYSFTAPRRHDARRRTSSTSLGSFGDNLLWSLHDLGADAGRSTSLVSLPAGYALVRYPFPGKRLLFSVLTLPLYVPGAVIGISLRARPTTSRTT